MANLLRDYPDLQTFVLQNVQLTGRIIGSGAYGSVQVGEMPGATCAIKKIHDIFQDRSEIPPAEMERSVRQFVQECQLMSTLRHPHIVQFFGICILPGSRLPALVMERLLTSLHDLLETQPHIPLGLKYSFIRDTAQGLCYLHDHIPSLIHRDLSARNVLLNSAMVAKIGDLGVARILPSLRSTATMTKAPGASIYMPPEALEDDSRYDVSIDVFSLGVVAIFILTQCFPHKVLAQVNRDQHGNAVIRSELERRVEYMQRIYSQFRDDHPLVYMIEQCLKSFPKDRPKIHQVLQMLDKARAEIDDAVCQLDRLALVQRVRELTLNVLSKDQQITAMTKENEMHKQSKLSREQELLEMIQSRDDELLLINHQIRSKDQELIRRIHLIESMEKENTQLVKDLTEKIQSQQTRIEELAKHVPVSHSLRVDLTIAHMLNIPPMYIMYFLFSITMYSHGQNSNFILRLIQTK